MDHAFDAAILGAAVGRGPIMADARFVQGYVEVEALESTTSVTSDVLDVGGGSGKAVGKADEDGCEFGLGFTWEGPGPVGGIVDHDKEVAFTVRTYGAGVPPCFGVQARAELHVAGGLSGTEG